jgi:hypothetical protein
MSGASNSERNNSQATISDTNFITVHTTNRARGFSLPCSLMLLSAETGGGKRSGSEFSKHFCVFLDLKKSLQVVTIPIYNANLYFFVYRSIRGQQTRKDYTGIMLIQPRPQCCSTRRSFVLGGLGFSEAMNG